jgi:hypothetical protein
MEVNGNVAVLGAVTTLLTGVLAVLGTWALKIYSKKAETMLAMKNADAETMLAIKKLEVGAEKGVNSRTVIELREALKKTDALLDKRGQEVHDANDKANTAMLKNAANEARLKACEDDRQELWDYVSQISEILRENSMKVPTIVRRGLSGNSDTGGEQ